MESVENCKQFPTLTTWKTPTTKTTELVLSCLERKTKKLKAGAVVVRFAQAEGLPAPWGECFAHARREPSAEILSRRQLYKL